MIRVERRKGQKREDERSGGVGAQGLLLAIYGPARSWTRKTRGGKGKNGEKPRDIEKKGQTRREGSGVDEQRGREMEKDQRGQERNEYQPSGHFGRVANRKDHSKLRQRNAIGDGWGGWSSDRFCVDGGEGGESRPSIDGAKFFSTSFSSLLIFELRRERFYRASISRSMLAPLAHVLV